MTKFIHTIALLAAATALLLATTAESARIVAQDEDAYELMLGDVALPGSTAGTVIFKTCGSCRTQSMRVSGTTVFQVHGQTVTFEDFSKAAEDFSQRDGGASSTIVYVFFDIKSQRVNRLGIDYLG